ncbi:DNA cytosine methyltransferase [Sphingomonas sp.]|uniref:DNA cytosine methyltransferase n=1 Tax=Sphingomonas sp. TaxID=28214 RepID=UPI003B3B1848
MGAGLFIDGFAGGGGASTGIAQAIGREVDIAINHSETAIAIHKANHPGTRHFCQDIRAIWPKAATRLEPVAGAWFSPDCKEYSRAKGAPVKDRHIRALSNEVTNWLREVRPAVAYLENVEEYETASPLDTDGIPIKAQAGKPFKRLIRQWRGLGYRVQWRKLKACDWGAPTSRRRLYIIMRCDGLPIVWPEPTHAPANDDRVLSGELMPYRTAAECIDWSIPIPSILDRAKPHADATNQRVAHGIVRHVIEAAKHGKAFFVPANGMGVPHITKFHGGSVGSPIDKEMPTVTGNGNPTRQAGASPLGLVDAKLAPFISYGQHGGANRPANDPHHTVAASKKDTNGIVAATLIGVGGRRAQSPPVALDSAYPTTTGKADAALASAFLTRFYGSDKRGAGGDPEQPLPVTRASGQHHGLVAAHMAQFNTNPDGSHNAGHSMRDQVSTVATRGPHQGIIETTMIEEGALSPEIMRRAVKVAAFLVKYYGEGGQDQAIDRPLDVITDKARFAVVTVTIDAITYVIVDIGLRMLTPRELARAQGFPDTYVLDPECWYTTDPSKRYPQGRRKFGRMPISKQISAIGNSVCPPVARALVAANQPQIADVRLAA